jgi:hypothetical protein
MRRITKNIRTGVKVFLQAVPIKSLLPMLCNYEVFRDIIEAKVGNNGNG